MRIPLQKSLAYKYESVDLLLRDGTIVEEIAIDASGFLLGKVVGGHDGVDESPLHFKQEDIKAYRFRSGLIAQLGFSKWHELDSRS